MIVNNGSTDVTTYFVLRDSTTHAPKTDVTVTDIDLYYVEERAAISAKIDCTALAAADSAHTDGGAFNVGQGMYRIDWPDAAFDGGVGKRVNLIVVCSGVDTTYFEIVLSPAVNVTLWKDQTAPDAPPTAAAVADAVWDEATSGHAAAGSTGKALTDILEDTGTTLPALLTSTLASFVNTYSTDATTAGSITRRRGDSWAIVPAALGVLTGYTSLWLTIKRSHDDADSASVLHVKKNASGLLDGLLYLNGAASTSNLASITVTDALTGVISIAVDEAATKELAPGEYYYDVQALIGGNVSTPDSGTFTVTADVTRSVV